MMENLKIRITPAIDCSTRSNIKLSFEHYFSAGDGGAAEVFVSGNNGASWTSLQAWSAPSTANAAVAEYNISAIAAGKSQVKIKWNWKGSYSWYWAIDDVLVFETEVHDLAVKKIVAPIEVFSDSIVSPVVTVSNLGFSTESAYAISLSDGKGYNETINVTTSISPASTYNVTFPDWTPSTGDYTLTATVTLVGDLDALNNSKTLAVTASPAKHDLAVNAILTPTSVLSDSIVSPVVVIGNLGDLSESLYAVTLTDNAGYIQTVNVTDAISVGATYNVTFPDWTPGDGIYTLTATVILAGDAIAANNAKSLNVTSTPAEHNLGVNSISVPPLVLSDSIVSPMVAVTNYGNYIESTYTVTLSDGGDYTKSVDVTNPIGIGTTASIPFPDWTPAEGPHNLTATVILAGDVNGSNNSATLIVTASNAKHDLAVGIINVPQEVLSDSIVSPVVVIVNTGNYPESAYSVLLSDGGTYAETVNVTDLMAVGANKNVSFPDWTPSTGSHTLTATLTLAGDMVVGNDIMTFNVTASAAKHDLAVLSFNVPSEVLSDSLVSPVVSIKNTGDYLESTYSVLLSDGSAYSETIDVTTSLAKGSIKNVAFPDWTPAEGSYTLTATVTLAGDADGSNNTKTLAVLASKAVHDLTVVAIPNAVERGATTVPIVTVKNSGDYKEAAYSVSLSDGGAYTQTVNVISALNVNTTYKVTFPDWTPADGTHTLTATVTLAGDEVTSNNSLSQECRVIDARIAYVSKYESGSLNGILNVPFDKFTAIGRSTYQIQSLGWKDSVLFAVTFDGNFGSVNTSDGSFTLIGSTGIPAMFFTSLIVDPTTGKIYTTTLAGGYPNFSVGLYRIDQTSGLGTLVATSPQQGTFAQFAFDKDGNLYSIEHRPGLDGLFYSVNKTTAEMTLIGDLGGVVSANFQPMAWDFYNNIMYFQASGTMQGSYAINLTTGAATLVGTPYAGQVLAMAMPVWDANLLDLKLDGVTIPTFSPGKYNYNVKLPSGTVSVPVATATPVYAKAAKVITNCAALPGTSTVVVTAPEGSSKTYTINFSVSENSDATLSNLMVKGVTVVGFNPSTLTYNVVLHSGSMSVPMVTATPNDANATVVFTTASALPGTTNVVVTAHDGTTQKTYSINFTVAAFSDATLIDLGVDGITVAGFVPSTYSYNVELPYGITVFPDVTAKTNDTRAVTVITNDASLPGATTIVVTANDGITTKTYTINFTIAVQTFTITFNVVNGNGTLAATVDAIAITSPTTVNTSKNIAFTAAPAANYVVKEWKLNETVITGNITNTYTLSSVSANSTISVEFKLATGINDINENELSVYPIPAVDKISVKMNTVINLISIVNINGQVLLQSKINNNEGTINISELSNGIYFLRVVTSNGVITKKIQVSK